MAWVLSSRADTARFGEALGRHLRPGQTVALIGDLGSGKTTMTRAIARGMGITAHVTSPTFGLIHEYPGPIPLYHFDPYRLQRPRDLVDLGFDEYLERDGVVIVEWANMLAELLPPERLTLNMEVDISSMVRYDLEDEPRMLRANATGADYAGLLDSLEGDASLKDLLVQADGPIES